MGNAIICDTNVRRLWISFNQMGKRGVVVAFLLLVCLVEFHGADLEIDGKDPKDNAGSELHKESGSTPLNNSGSVPLSHSNSTFDGEGDDIKHDIQVGKRNSSQVEVEQMKNRTEQVPEHLKLSGNDTAENGIEARDRERSPRKENGKPDEIIKTTNKSVPADTLPVHKHKVSATEEQKPIDDSETSDRTGDTREEVQHKAVHKKKKRRGGYTSDNPSKKDNSGVEECDTSNRCIDEKNKLIACLRVPGNESPHLSLLIQNKGTKALTIKISAPSFAQLEKTTVQLKEKEDDKVMVSLGNNDTDVNNTILLLTSGDGQCALNLRGIFLTEISKRPSSRQYPYIKMITPNFIMYLSLVAAVLICGGWMFFRLRGRLGSRSNIKYQQLDTDLPISSGGRAESINGDGWDDNWDDNWDDEEAPVTSSKPVQSFSSKGLASRRSNHKDDWHNWKD